MTDSLEKLKQEVQYRPPNFHPSDYDIPPGPPAWATRRFRMMPAELWELAWDPHYLSPFLSSRRFIDTPSPMEKAYFTEENMNHLMNTILDTFEEFYGAKLGQQSETSLLSIMSRVYDDHVRSLPSGYMDERETFLAAIAYLDSFVLDDSIRIMVRELKDYIKDRKHWEVNPVPELPLPKWTSSKNEHPLATVPFFTTKFPLKRPPGTVEDLSKLGTWPS